jgi:hypothetical protein
MFEGRPYGDLADKSFGPALSDQADDLIMDRLNTLFP